MVASSTTNIRWSELYCFYPFLTLIFGMFNFCRNYSSISGIVSIYLMRYISWDISTSQRLSFERTIDLCSLFCNSPQIYLLGLRSELSGGLVHPFQWSSRFLPSQGVPAIVCFMGIAMWAFNRDREDSPKSLLVDKFLPVNRVHRYIAHPYC